MKKLFPKKKAPSADTGEADLKQSINQIKVGIKKYEKDAQEFSVKARAAVATGNVNLAKNYLVRKKHALQNLDKFQGFIIKLERQQEAIETAKNMKAMGQSLKSTTAVLKRSVEELDPEKILEANEEAEEAMAALNEAGEAMSDNPDAEYETDEINDELEELKSEVLLSGENLPETPTSMLSVPMDEEPENVEDEATKSEKLKKELERLKKELD